MTRIMIMVIKKMITLLFMMKCDFCEYDEECWQPNSLKKGQQDTKLQTLFYFATKHPSTLHPKHSIELVSLDAELYLWLAMCKMRYHGREIESTLALERKRSIRHPRSLSNPSKSSTKIKEITLSFLGK